MSVASAKSPVISYTTTAVVSAVSNADAVIFSKIIPKGKWIIAGSVDASVDTIGETLPSVALSTNVRNLSVLVTGTGPNAVIIPYSFIYTSDGTTPLVMTLDCTTSAGTWSSDPNAIDFAELI